MVFHQTTGRTPCYPSQMLDGTINTEICNMYPAMGKSMRNLLLQNLGVVEHHTVYIAAFELVDKCNRQIEFAVSPDVYHALEEGTTEALTYRIGFLIQFGNIVNVSQPRGVDFVHLN